MLCLDDCFPTIMMSQPTEITQFISNQPLSAVHPQAKRARLKESLSLSPLLVIQRKRGKPTWP
jgi:hypothetical protein